MALATADQLDFLPLFPDETEEAILERMRGWANEGLDPSADADLWVDTREGSHWATTVTPCARELARFYDRAGTEVPMSAMPVWSWGSYLDDLAATYRVFRLAATQAGGLVTFSGPEGTTIAAGTTVSAEPTSEEGEQPPEFVVTTAGTIAAGKSEIELPVVAVEPGAASNVAANAISVVVSTLAGVEVINAEAIGGGSDVETDEALLERLLEAFEGRAGGRKSDYRAWAREVEGVGRATVIANWQGAGTVLVVISDAEGNPASPETVETLQRVLDPVPGAGEGKAPIGAVVTVEAATLLNVTVSATIDFEEGYSLDGTGGTVALRAPLEAVVEGYVESVQSGEEVVLSQALGRMALVPGVHDVGLGRVNGVAGNLAVPTSPPQQPALKELALTEGTP